MKKMLIALLLALTLLVSAVPSFAEEAPKELKFVYIDGWSSVDDGDTTSAITQKIAEETGVLISPVTAGGDRGTILLSSGEIGDCLMVYNATMLKTCVENGMMLDLSTLVSEEKTPAILSNPDRIQMAQVLSETDDGSYYFLPVQCGSEGAPMTPYHSLFNVRWDLYKQMGYPEVTDTDSMLALLSEMQKLNPTTEDGKTVYGYSLELGNFRNAYWPWHYTFGYYTSNDFISTNINTGEMVYEPLDENSPMWSFLEYLNKAYKAGLFDPDSFTQTGDDMKAKIAAGQVLSPIWASDGVQYEAANPNTAEEFRGFQTLPVEGTTYWCNSYYNGGWDACFVGIPASSSDPEAALRVLEYLSTDDGARLVDSGIQGVHWDYDENGVPTLTDEIIEAYESTSSTSKPTLWRVCSYFLPGLPSPTTMYISLLPLAHRVSVYCSKQTGALSSARMEKRAFSLTARRGADIIEAGFSSICERRALRHEMGASHAHRAHQPLRAGSGGGGNRGLRGLGLRRRGRHRPL